MLKIIQALLARPKIADSIVLLLGLLVPFTFAPYQLPYLIFPLLVLFIFLILDQTNKRSFWRGWLFGFGQFVIGFNWIYHSVHTYGHAPAAMAITMIIALAAYCALFPGLAAYLAQRLFKQNKTLFILLGLPLMWALSEWLRGYLFTGFPWLSLGVSQVDTSLAGFAPVFGALGLGAVVVLVAGLLLLLITERTKFRFYFAGLLIVFIGGYLLSVINWSEKISSPLRVSLPQLSITQDQKWRAVNKSASLQWYRQQLVENTNSDIMIWPETAIPSFIKREASYWNTVKKLAEQSDTEVIAGVFMRDETTGRYYNSLVSTNGDYYQKKHLVPLGEYMPFRGVFEFLRRYIQFPMSDIANGKDDQPLMSVAGFKVGASICFEDVFDRDIRSSLPEAAFLINASNDGWFKRTAEPHQHHQIARMRALESARYLLRATNTGVSSIIGPKGESIVISQLYDKVTISGEIYAMKGSTPYVFWGNYPLICLAIIVLFWRVRQTNTAK